MDFGIGWYSSEGKPGVFHSVEPAWNDRNLRDLAQHLTSPLVLAHIRASTGAAVQQTNCHPFRYGRWLWMHNGQLREFNSVKRDLAFAVDPSLYPSIEGSTDSELFFYLALTLGLQDDPLSAVERAVGFIEATGHAHGIQHPIQMTVATTDGALFGSSVTPAKANPARCSAALLSRPCEPSTRNIPSAQAFPETRLVVSEPLSDLAGAWNEVPESSCGIVGHGQDELRPFRPR